MDWIDKRLRGIAIRQDLTDEWKTRGIQEQKDFAILTNEISKATFGKTVGEYKKFIKMLHSETTWLTSPASTKYHQIIKRLIGIIIENSQDGIKSNYTKFIESKGKNYTPYM